MLSDTVLCCVVGLQFGLQNSFVRFGPATSVLRRLTQAELASQADNACSPFWYVKVVDLNDADSQANNRVSAFRL